MLSSLLDHFDSLLPRIRQKLPIQNPLHSFVHNNILQMFEGKDFHEAVQEAGKLYRANPYWPIERYKEKFREGKISEEDVFKSIALYLGHYPAISSLDLLGMTPKEYFYRLMFSELSFNNDDTQPAIDDLELWNLCQEKMLGERLVLRRSPVLWRGRGYWEKYHQESFPLNVHPFIIRHISTYLDQGQSFWPNPYASRSYWDYFLKSCEELKGFTSGWVTVLLERVEFHRDSSPREIICRELARMGIPSEVWEDYLLELLFDLKGWSGMVNKLETEPWQATVKAPAISLVDYLASILLIESAVDGFYSEQKSIDLSLIYGRKDVLELRSYNLSLALYQITKSFKLDNRWMQRLDKADLLKLIDEIDESEFRDNVRLWHEAFEHHFHRKAIEAIVEHSTHPTEVVSPYASVLFCIDDREESMRRHLEEVDHGIKTYGVVGFFGIDMKFSGVKSPRLIAQCPPVVSPSRVIREVTTERESRFEWWKSFSGSNDLRLYYSSRTLFRGFFSSLVLGALSLVPMFMEVFFPERSKTLRRKIIRSLRLEPKTDMLIEAKEHGHGYSKKEMAAIVASIVNMCGLKSPLSELVVTLGHGSTSNNNPFKQAYGCGACGGNAGIPNSRAFAKMANDPEVRKELRNLGVEITDGAFILAGFHDTSTDEVLFFNEEDVPAHFKEGVAKLKQSLQEACKLNAFERCQRFSSFPKDGTPDTALKHVRERAHDLAQPRPEYGHSSNALAIVGKRELTRGLFLNRRAFLLTYDWESDPDGSILKDVVVGGVPVSVNINMDYYFSSVDNENFGCGSKLPLNMTSLLGVMTGSQSDLRIGLARQMIEIHEPIRNLTIIESPLERVDSLFRGHARLKNILFHHWMRLVVKDPQKGWFIFSQDKFEPLDMSVHPMKHFDSSIDLIQQTHTEEDFAEIDS
jgi:uncharacterized protein YbcC (UPF0753/DUF2309 family)